MSLTICKLISSELEAMSSYEPPTLAPQNYDAVVTELSKNVTHLEILQKILSIGSDGLDKIDMHWRERGAEINNTSLKELFAYKVEEITDETVFYFGNLDYNEYKKVNPKANCLPDSLKVVFGKVSAIDSDITTIDMVFIEGEINIFRCHNLPEVKIQTLDGKGYFTDSNLLKSLIINNGQDKSTVTLKQCKSLENAIIGINYVNLVLTELPQLQQLIVGSKQSDLGLAGCTKLTLQGVNSVNQEKILIKNLISVNDYFAKPEPGDIFGNLSYKFNDFGYTAKQIHTKFEVELNQIMIIY